MRDILIEFMDSLRDYVAESGTNIAHDERDSSEFVDIFLNQGQSLPIDSVSDWLPFKGNKDLFKKAWEKNYLLLFDDGSICRYRDEHPMAIMTHFKLN